jgi:hypothetical protein
MSNYSDDNNHVRYISHGYKDRNDYLDTLADDWGIDNTTVHMIADMLGPSEDFDGLLSELEDFEYIGLFNGLNNEEVDDGGKEKEPPSEAPPESKDGPTKIS